MKRTMLIAVVVVALVFGLVAYAGAAVQGTVTASATVPSVLSLTLNDTAVSFAISDPDAVTTGDAAQTVTVKSNQLYDLTYTATDFTAGALTMPVTVMRFNYDGAGMTALSSGASVSIVDEGARGTHAKSIAYDIQPTLLYDPAPYSSVITYDLVVD